MCYVGCVWAWNSPLGDAFNAQGELYVCDALKVGGGWVGAGGWGCVWTQAMQPANASGNHSVS